MIPLVALSVLLSSAPAIASGPVVTTEQAMRRLEGVGETEMLCFSASASTYCSAGLAGGVLYGLTPRWALGFAIRQGFELNTSFRAIYTGFQVNGEYAILGGTQSVSETTLIDGREVARRAPTGSSTLRLRLSVNQHFFNTSNQSLPYSGFGAGLFYRFPITESLRLGFGLKIDRLMRGSVVLSPFSGVVSISFWL